MSENPSLIEANKKPRKEVQEANESMQKLITQYEQERTELEERITSEQNRVADLTTSLSRAKGKSGSATLSPTNQSSEEGSERLTAEELNDFADMIEAAHTTLHDYNKALAALKRQKTRLVNNNSEDDQPEINRLNIEIENLLRQIDSQNQAAQSQKDPERRVSKVENEHREVLQGFVDELGAVGLGQPRDRILAAIKNQKAKIAELEKRAGRKNSGPTEAQLSQELQNAAQNIHQLELDKNGLQTEMASLTKRIRILERERDAVKTASGEASMELGEPVASGSKGDVSTSIRALGIELRATKLLYEEALEKVKGLEARVEENDALLRQINEERPDDEQFESFQDFLSEFREGIDDRMERAVSQHQELANRYRTERNVLRGQLSDSKSIFKTNLGQETKMMYSPGECGKCACRGRSLREI